MDQTTPQTPPDPIPNPASPIGFWNLVVAAITLARTDAGRRRLFLLAALFGLAGLSGLVDATWLAWFPDLKVTPEANRVNGWDPTLAQEEGPRIAATQPKFAVRDQDGRQVSKAGIFVDLSKFVKAANHGQHLLLPPQETGDCTSFAVTNGLIYRHGFQIAKENRHELLKPSFPPWNYGLGRVQVGRRQIRGAGSVTAWNLQGLQGYGILSWDDADLAGFKYSGNLADHWGNEGPAVRVMKSAAPFHLKSFAAMRSWSDVVDAIGNGYPIPFGASLTFGKATRERDGKRWLQPNGKGGHAQCLIAVEDRPGHEPGAYCLGSWGPDAHDRPLNGEPPGGGWVSKDIVERIILPGRDCWAISDADGFPAEKLADWNAFREERERSGGVAAVVAAEAPEPTTLKEVREMHAAPISLCLVGIACLVFLYAVNRSWFGIGSRSVSMLLALAMLGVGCTSDAGYKHRAKVAARCQSPNFATFQSAATSCDPLNCGCAPSCQCPQPALARAREVRSTGAAPVASRCVPCSQERCVGWNCLVDPSPPLAPAAGSRTTPVVATAQQSTWNALTTEPIACASWNALAIAEPQVVRQVCTGEGCYLVPE